MEIGKLIVVNTSLRVTVVSNLDVQRGVGVIFDPKNYIADFFGFKTVYFGHKFWKKCPKRGGRGRESLPNSNPKNFIANLRILTNF